MAKVYERKDSTTLICYNVDKVFDRDSANSNYDRDDWDQPRQRTLLASESLEDITKECNDQSFNIVSLSGLYCEEHFSMAIHFEDNNIICVFSREANIDFEKFANDLKLND